MNPIIIKDKNISAKDIEGKPVLISLVNKIQRGGFILVLILIVIIKSIILQYHDVKL